MTDKQVEALKVRHQKEIDTLIVKHNKEIDKLNANHLKQLNNISNNISKTSTTFEQVIKTIGDNETLGKKDLLAVKKGITKAITILVDLVI